MHSRVEPLETVPLVTAELSSLWRWSEPSGRLAIQSVNVPPTSIQNCHNCRIGAPVVWYAAQRRGRSSKMISISVRRTISESRAEVCSSPSVYRVESRVESPFHERLQARRPEPQIYAAFPGPVWVALALPVSAGDSQVRTARAASFSSGPQGRAVEAVAGPARAQPFGSVVFI